MYPDTQNNKTLNIISKIVTIVALLVVVIVAFMYTWSAIDSYLKEPKTASVEEASTVSDDEKKNLIGDLEKTNSRNISERDRADILSEMSVKGTVSNQERDGILNSLK